MLSRRLRLSAILMLIGSIYAAAAAPARAADDTPAGVVNAIVKLLKEKKSPEVVLDFVHWYTAFASFPEKDKKQINVNTPEELHQYYIRVFRDPAALLREQLAPKIQAAPQEQRPAFEAQLKKMEGVIQERFADMTEKLGRTEFTVGKVDEKGDTATVALSTLVDGKITASEARLIRVEGKWMLPDPTFVRLPADEQGKVADPGVTRIQPQVAPPPTAAPAPATPAQNETK